jgi:hypothetical protein
MQLYCTHSIVYDGKPWWVVDKLIAQVTCVQSIDVLHDRLGDEQ